VFLLSEDFLTNQKRLFEHYCAYFKKFEEFRKIFLKITENYGVLVINTQEREREINKKIFSYRSKPIFNFTFGSDRFIAYHKKKFDQNWSNNQQNTLKLNKDTVVRFQKK
jgi:hypothetical protein